VGGFAAIKEPRRAALGLLYAWLGDELFNGDYVHLLGAFSAVELKLLQGMLNKQLNCPMTSSIGRLFDAFASLLDLCQISEFEGHAAMALEAYAMRCMVQHDKIVFPCSAWQRDTDECLVLDWQPLLENVLADLAVCSHEEIAARIHHNLADWIFTVAEKNNAERIVLSGGCFQNAYLVEAIVKAEQAPHYTLFRHADIPPNDGGLALGQIYAAALK
jgi:hydrogenase maturation protein HypF